MLGIMATGDTLVAAEVGNSLYVDWQTEHLN